ncbi:MAG TPA: M20/M25/M40 family metallo-hydrolase [Longimicrobiaceae bacterium]|nr:M20/M25/M40 family metallo-hydrolase [Longimicrobiaceae bacterium]
MNLKSLSTAFPLASLLLAGGCAAAPSATPPAPSPTTEIRGAETITAEDMYARVAFLASDLLRGRDTPSRGLDIAASYLVSEYRLLGLEPAGENGTYYQHYPFPLLALDTATLHFGTIAGSDNENRMLAYGTDFFVSGVLDPVRDEGASMGHARLVFIGNLGEEGLPAGAYEGAAPIVTLPGAYSRDWRATASRARRAATEAGARALVLVVEPEFPRDDFQALAESFAEPGRTIPTPGEIPVFYLTHAAAEGVVARAGTSLAELASASAPTPLERVESHFAGTLLRVDDAQAPNVAAVLRGSDPDLRDEYVILSAHMDHVGVGDPVNGDSIFNGADDDASGTSGLLEVAQAFASLEERPRRSIIFLHVSGEEKGLLGSRWYSEHPTVPLEQIVANINVDMIGRNAPDSVVVIGKDYSSLGDVVNAVGASHPELDLVAADDIWPEERFFFRSDHFNFARKEIPAIFFFTGVHEDYHRPSDEVDALDVDKAARVAKLIFYTVRSIANDPQAPTWDPAGLAEVRALTR